MTAWNAAEYDASFSFVTEYGASLLDLLDPRPGERILDLGCGTGHLTADLAARGARPLGIDADAGMIEAARAAHPHCAFAVVDAHVVDTRIGTAESFDAAFSNAALHWMSDPGAVFRAVHALLVPGGRFVAESGGDGNVAAIRAAAHQARADLGLPAVAEPWDFPTPAEQATRLEAAGFRVTLLQRFERPTPLTGSAADWIRMFGGSFLADVPAESLPEFAAAVDRHAAALAGSDGWRADYVRLRFSATAVGGPS